MMEEKNSYRSNTTNIKGEIKNLQFRKDFTKEYRDLKDFYLDDEKKDKLKNMGRLQRFFFQSGYLISSIFKKLTPLRKLLVIIGLVLMFLSSIRIDNQNSSSNNTLLGGLLIFFVLVLELKDKLLAVEELIAGRKIQKALMPQESPQLDGWDIFLFTSSANEVGGDLVDYLRLDENKAVLTMADVAGKGLKAALLTSKLQATVRALATEINSISDLGKKINKIFHRDSLPNLFASMLFMQIDSVSGKVNYLNAGHFPPLIVKEKDIKEFPKGDAALGLIANTEYNEQTITLEPNEIFIAYSDGVFEARNENGMFFGMERFFQLIKNSSNNSPMQIGKYIISQLEHFIGDSPAADDISLIIMKRNS